MFGEAGHVYMFFSYGSNWCMNLTTERVGEPGAVLIRALGPVGGIDQMKKNRAKAEIGTLTNGPGKLTMALSIDSEFNGEDVVSSKRLYLLERTAPVRVRSSTRVGISKAREKPWRYFIEGNPFVSRA